MIVHELSRQEARQIAVRAQLLDGQRPDDLVDVVRQLTILQADQTAVIAPNADLVLWSRLGSSYDPADLADALEDRTLIELRGMIRQREDLALFRAEMAGWAERTGLRDWELEQRDWVDANDECRRDILRRLDFDGPLPASAFPDLCRVRWGSSGWNDNRNVSRLLDFMVLRGEVAVAGRDGRDRLWDLASRVYAGEVIEVEQARRIRDERRVRSLGIARMKSAQAPGEPTDVRDTGAAARIAGVRGQWRVDPAQLGGLPFTGRAALLSPLDRLIFDRKRMSELFEFDYQLEMYKPAAKRRWGYWALPILYGDRLVGKLDATADRKARVLRVDAIHQDVPFGEEMSAAVAGEIQELARWLGLALDLPRPAGRFIGKR